VSLLPVHLLGSSALRKRSPEVAGADEKARAFIADLFDTMRAYKGVGLAANQVGELLRIAVVETDPEHRYALVNPVIVERQGSIKEEEGCLSIPDIYGDVERAARVVVEALDENGVKRRIEGTELLARVLQHEIDHLDGIVFLDRVGPFKRRRLLKQWEKSREGKPGLVRDDVPESAPEDAAKA
jgi:peptide deformylase